VHDDVRADELLAPRLVAGGEELAGEALHGALVRLRGREVCPWLRCSCRGGRWTA
jgi:hypothetical protein